MNLETYREHLNELQLEIHDLRERMKNMVEVVRCKDCKWKQGSECVMFSDVRPFPDDFCSRAERRTDGSD